MSNKEFIITLNIKNVSILTGHGTDKVNITFDGPTPFPEMQEAEPDKNYFPILRAEIRAGHGIDWLKMIGVPEEMVEIIRLA